MLLLMLLPSVLSQGVTTPATPTFPFEDIDDPNAQCVDILICYDPIVLSWFFLNTLFYKGALTFSAMSRSLGATTRRKFAGSGKQKLARRSQRRSESIFVFIVNNINNVIFSSNIYNVNYYFNFHHVLLTQVCMEVPETECELVGYTECDSYKNSMPARDDMVMTINFVISLIIMVVVTQVVGEFFNEQDCSTRPITVTEMKMQPECVDQTKVKRNDQSNMKQKYET